MISSRQRFRPVALASAGPSGSAFFFKKTTLMNDYGILELASAMERSAALIEEAARTTSESRGVIKARGAFLIYLAGVLRSWVPNPQHTVVEDDDIL